VRFGLINGLAKNNNTTRILLTGRETGLLMSEQYANHINPIELRLQIIVVVILIPFSLALALYTHKWVAGAVPLLLTFIAIIVFFSIDLRQYPSQVDIDRNGITMRFRIGRPKSYIWHQIADMYLPPIQEGNMRYGGFRIKGNSHPFQIEGKIALQIWAAFKEATGAYLPSWDGKSESKVALAEVRR